MHNGGNPLHWVATEEAALALGKMSCNHETQNHRGQTALHVMVNYNRFDCVVALLSSGANPNESNSHGDTPLHMAVLSLDLSIVKVKENLFEIQH